MTNCICAHAHGRLRIMHWRAALMLAVALLIALAGQAWARQPLAAIVVDARTGKVLYARNADAPRYPASITKVMTLYLLFREMKAGRISPKSRIRISRHAASMQPSKLWLKPGQSISVDQAIRALTVKSANDVAVAVAEKLAGTESAFARRMTQMARALGMTRTIFRNASGLPHPVNVTTARDLATLSLRLMRDFPEYYRKYFSLRYFVWRGRRHRNHNHLLGRVPGMDGIKTGYTRAAGSNLAASVRRGGKRIVAVVLGASSSRARNAYMRRLIEMAFRRYQLATGTRIATLAGMPPGYSPARAQALLARLGHNGAERRKDMKKRRQKIATSRIKPRPRVKVAHIVPAPRPEEARALDRLASAAATMPAEPKQSAKTASARKITKTPPPAPRVRSTPFGDKQAAGSKRPSSTSRKKATHTRTAHETPKRPAATAPGMLAANVMVRVLEEEAQAEDAEDSSNAQTTRHANDAAASDTAGSASSPQGKHVADTAHDNTVMAANIHAMPGAGQIHAESAPPALRTQTPAASDTLVITKASAPPPREHLPEHKVDTPAPVRTGSGNITTPYIIADNPDQVRELLGSHWLIQIVATPSLDAAQRLLLKARKASPQVRGKPSFVVRVNRNGRTFYRARFAGFSEKQARRACHELKRRGMSCMLMAPGAG